MKNIKHFLLAGLAILSMGLVATGVVSGERKAEPVTAAAGDYYASISDTLTGEDLLKALNKLNTTKRTRLVGYAGMRTFAKTSDADPNGSGKILSFYDNALVGPNWDSGNTWNREHVWPNIRGGDAVEDDAHMVRPSATSTNSDRGSKGYGVSSYDPGKYVEYYRGSASRIIFYAAMADLSLSLIDDPLNYHGAGSHPNCMGSLSEMLAWNLQYQPNNTSFTGANDIARRAELNRNEAIQTASGGQGNRNPFIDHPEYACRIWGNYNAATKAACSGSVIPPDPETKATSITLNYSSYSIEVGGKVQLTPSPVPTGAVLPSLSWISDNNSVASVNGSGLVTGLKDGKATVSVYSNDGLYASCEITVGSGKESPASTGGCGGNIATTSTILATLSILGVSLLLIKRKYTN